MSIASTADILLAYLHEDEGRASLSDAAHATVSGEGLLSQQVVVSSAIESLSEQELLAQETGPDGGVMLALTEDGRTQAADAYDRLAALEIEYVDGSRRACTVDTAAAQTGWSVPEVAVRCSDDGVLFADEGGLEDRIVNRDDERDLWLERLDRCQADGHGELVLLRGVSGIGKTTLAEALEADAQDRDEAVEILRTSCGITGTEPYQPIRELVGNTEGATDPFETVDDTNVDPHSPTSSPEIYQGQQTALFESITECLAPTDGEPLRIAVIDDLHHADAATRSYLRYLVERLSDLRLVLVCTTLPEELVDTVPESGTTTDDEMPPSPTPSDLSRAATHLTTVDLEGFDWDDTRRLIESTVGHRGAPEAFVDAVQKRTDGKPFHVEATVQALLDDDQLDPSFRWYPDRPDAIELPDQAQETIMQSIEGLDGTARSVLQWAAIAGDPVPVSVIADLCEDSNRAVITTVDLLVQANQLQRSHATDEVTIQTELTRETLLSALDESERMDRHERLATALAATSGGDGDTALVAHQYEAAEDPARAIEWYRTAIDEATGVYAHETAVEHCHRLLTTARAHGYASVVLDASEQFVEIYSTIGEYEQATRHLRFLEERVEAADTERKRKIARYKASIATDRGEYETADSEIETGLALADEESEHRCRLLGIAATTALERGDYETAVDEATKQLDLATELDTDRYRAEALVVLGTVASRRGEYDQAEQRLEQAKSIAMEIGERRLTAEAIHRLGLVDWNQSEYDSALERYERCLDHRQAIDDRHGEARALNNLGIIEQDRANLSAARGYYERSLEIHREIRNRHDAARSMHNLGMIAMLQSEYDTALDYYDRCLEIERDIDDRFGQSIGLTDLGRLKHQRGEYEAAIDYQNRALSIKRERNNQRREAVSLIYRAASRRELGAIDDARDDAQAGLDIAQSLDTSQEIGTGLRELAAIERKAGNVREAMEHAQESIDILEACDASIHAAETYLEYARGALAAGDADSAREAVTTARETFEAVDATHSIGHCRLVQGDLSARTMAFSDARAHWQVALDAFESTGANHHAVDTLERFVDACHRQDDTVQARELCDRALELLQDATVDALDGREVWFQDRRTRFDES